MTDDDSETIQYEAFKVNHRVSDESPDLFLFTESANELIRWAEVPRANVDFMDGYQRQLEPGRVEDISDYFKNKENIIPGAVLVTVNQEHLDIHHGDNNSAEIEITLPESRDTKDILQQAAKDLYERLGEEGKNHIDSLSFSEESDESDQGNDDLEENESGKPVSYLARKTAELKEAIENFEDLPDETLRNLEEFADRAASPGLIIDGQHRVFGAKTYPEEIKYPIVLIPGLETKEQVYHFYIINDKAEPIPQEELLITVATALSEKESDDLMGKLLQADVNVNKARYPYMADVEKISPFHQMINYEEKVGEQTGVIGFRDMYRLMNRFVDMKGGNTNLYQPIDEWDTSTRYRIKKFYTFWSAIKEHYSELWDDAEASIEGEDFDDQFPEQFFRKDAMRVLQDYILDRLSDKQESRTELLNELEDVDEGVKDELQRHILEDDEKLKKEINNVLEDLPEEFFRKEWQTSGLSTSENRNNFREEIEKAVNTTAKGLPKLRIFNKGF